MENRFLNQVLGRNAFFPSSLSCQLPARISLPVCNSRFPLPREMHAAQNYLQPRFSAGLGQSLRWMVSSLSGAAPILETPSGEMWPNDAETRTDRTRTTLQAKPGDDGRLYANVIERVAQLWPFHLIQWFTDGLEREYHQVFGCRTAITMTPQRH